MILIYVINVELIGIKIIHYLKCMVHNLLLYQILLIEITLCKIYSSELDFFKIQMRIVLNLVYYWLDFDLVPNNHMEHLNLVDLIDYPMFVLDS